MSSNRRSSAGRLAVLGALLLLVATASGCGVGLPTQPDVDSDQVQGPSAAAAGGQESSFEIGDGMLSGSTPDDVVAPEIVVQTPGPRIGGWAKGHYKEKHKPH